MTRFIMNASTAFRTSGKIFSLFLATNTGFLFGSSFLRNSLYSIYSAKRLFGASYSYCDKLSYSDQKEFLDCIKTGVLENVKSKYEKSMVPEELLFAQYAGDK